MEFKRIFVKKEECHLWSVCYPEDKIGKRNKDVFSIMIKRWSDTQYLLNYFREHERDLANPFWKGMSIDNAIDQVLDESLDIENELKAIEAKKPGYENRSFREIFKPLHENIYSLKWDQEQYRKAKPDFKTPFLRIYAIELDEGCYVITGGAIKLTEKMLGGVFEEEFRKLKRVRGFLINEGITTKQGLDEE